MSEETIALELKNQEEFLLEIEEIKKKIKNKGLDWKERKKSRNDKINKTRGLIYIGHLPHGFYENEMNDFFKQFGHVTNVKLCRSKRTGKSKGYGFVEFKHPDVAKIAAETMNNYLMFKKRLISNFIEFEDRPKYLFHEKFKTTADDYSLKRKCDNLKFLKNRQLDEREVEVKIFKYVNTLKKQLEKIRKMGINYHLTPVDIPKNLKTKLSKNLQKLSGQQDNKVESKKSIKKISKKQSVIGKSKSVTENQLQVKYRKGIKQNMLKRKIKNYVTLNNN